MCLAPVTGMSAIFKFIATWFSYTGSCVFSPDATCQPFLAFVALLVAATVGLVLVVMAYRRAEERVTTTLEEEEGVSELEERRARQHAQIRERIRRATMPHALRTNRPLRGELSTAV